MDPVTATTAAMAVISAASQIFGGIKKSRNAKKAMQEEKRKLAEERANNENYYRANYYADATQMADNQRALTQARENLRRNNQAAAGTSAVMGGTNAQAAATKEANNKAMADATSAVAANAQSYKQHVQDSYRTQADAINQRNINLIKEREAANASAIDTAVSGVNTAAQGATSAVASYYKPANTKAV